MSERRIVYEDGPAIDVEDNKKWVTELKRSVKWNEEA